MRTPSVFRFAIVVSVLFVSFGTVSTARAALAITDVDASAFPEIAVSVTASEAVDCMTLGDGLVLTENGTAVAADVTVESSSTGRTLVVVLSNSVYLSAAELFRVTREATALVERLDPGDRVGLVRYAGCDVFTVEPTTDHAAVLAAIDASSSFGSGIASDALYVGVDMACGAGGGSVVYVGEGIEGASDRCDLAPNDGFGPDENLADDVDHIVALASCGVTVSSILLDDFNRNDLFAPVADATGGLVRSDDTVTDVDRDAMLDAAGSPAGCAFTVRYTSPNTDADGTVRTVEICSNLVGSCASATYTAECLVEVALDAATQAVFGADCVTPGARELGVVASVCASATAGTVSLDDGVDVVTLALASDGARWSTTVGADLLTAGRAFDVVFEITTGEGTLRLPPTGSYALAGCDDDPGEDLTLSLPAVEVEPGTVVEVPLELRGDGLGFVASTQTRIAFDPTVLEILDVTDDGTVASQADWLAPVWAVDAGDLRIAQAGSLPLPSVGVLARLQVRVLEDASGDCSALDLVEAVLDDGEAPVVLEDGEVCAGPGCVQGRVVLWSDADTGIEGFDVRRDADGVVLATTDAEGRFSICPAPASPLRVELDGASADAELVSPFDAALVLQSAVQLHDLSVPSVERTCDGVTDAWTPRRIAADASGDGEVGAFDASLILQWLVGQIDALPAGRWRAACEVSALEASQPNPLPVVKMGDVSSGSETVTRAVAAHAAWKAVDPEGTTWELEIDGPAVAVDLHFEGAPGVKPVIGKDWEWATGPLDGATRVVLARARSREHSILRFGFGAPFDPTRSGRVVLDDREVKASVVETAPAATASSWWASVADDGARVLISWSQMAFERDAAVDVFDLRGRRVARIPVHRATGTVDWNGTDTAGRSVAPGVYLLRLSADGTSHGTRKIALLSR